MIGALGLKFGDLAPIRALITRSMYNRHFSTFGLACLLLAIWPKGRKIWDDCRATSLVCTGQLLLYVVMFQYLLLQLCGLAQIAFERLSFDLLDGLDADIRAIFRAIALAFPTSRFKIRRWLPVLYCRWCVAKIAWIIFSSAYSCTFEICESDFSVTLSLDRVYTLLDVGRGLILITSSVEIWRCALSILV